MNQREIKFRAWDKKRLKMFNVFGLEFHLKNKILCDAIAGLVAEGKPDDDEKYRGLSSVSISGHPYSLAKSVKINDVVLMQYIGLKDRNGKEIYEGDILSHEFHSRPVVVSFKDGAFEAESVDILNESISVIGSIYENPELLEPPCKT